MRPLPLLALLVACGDKDPVDTGPADVGQDSADPCAGEADGTVIARDEPACGAFTHECDPTGSRVVVETTCDGGVSTAVELPEDCTRDVEAESGCVVHEGDLTIGGEEDIAALNGVQAIIGRVVINTDDTTGLESLAYVSGPIGMGVRPLSALGGLTGLRSAEGGLSLLCVSGDDLTPLAGLETIGGDLTIVGAGDLTALSLPALKTIRGELQLDWASDQACGGGARTLFSLVEIGPFSPELTRVGALSISSTRIMEGLGAIESITEVDGDITFLDNTALSECLIEDWLEGVAYGGGFEQRNNADCQ